MTTETREINGEEQIARLREAVERRSPVGGSLSRPIALTADFVAEA